MERLRLWGLLHWLEQAMTHGYSPERLKRAAELRKLREDPAFRSLVK